jgi:type I restriction enzyme S subunit
MTRKSYLINNPPERSVFASYLIRLRAKPEINPKLVFYFLNGYLYWSQISDLKSGSAQPNVNTRKLMQLSIPQVSPDVIEPIVPLLEHPAEHDSSFSEIRGQIDDALTKYDSIIKMADLLTQQDSCVSELRQAILQEAVQGKLVPQDPNNEPASELLKRIKADREKLIKQGKIKKEKQAAAHY